MEIEKLLIDKSKVYQLACAGCTRHGETLGECNHDEPCERLIFAFTVAEPVDAVEVVRCKDCKYWEDGYFGYCTKAHTAMEYNAFCSNGERKNDGT